MDYLIIAEIVDKLIGHTNTYYETNYDNESNKNIKEKGSLVLKLLDEMLEDYSHTKDTCRGEYSGKANMKEFEKVFDEIKEHIDDVTIVYEDE